MSDNRNITSTNYTEGDSSRTTNIHDQGINVERDYINNPETKQNLVEAAKEIQKLLDQLSQTYPTNTKKEKKIFAVEAIDLIEQNPSLTQKLLSAIKSGSIAALESMLNHPAASFVIAAMEDLQEDK